MSAESGTRAPFERSEEYRHTVLGYAASLNRWIEQVTAGASAGAEPLPPDVAGYTDELLEAIRAANRHRPVLDIKGEWPICHEAILPAARQSPINNVLFLDDGSVVAHMGDAGQDGGWVFWLRGDEHQVLDGVAFVGRSADRRYYAMATEADVAVTDGWGGPVVARFAWPDGTQGLPSGVTVQPFAQRPVVAQLVPFFGGQRVLLVSQRGVFVLDEAGARRLLPDDATVAGQAVAGGELPALDTLAHGAVSPRGDLVVTGCQTTDHLVFAADALDRGPRDVVRAASEHPELALFSADGTHVALASGLSDAGLTVWVDLPRYLALEPGADVPDDVVRPVAAGPRVRCAALRGDELVLGCANGYVCGVDPKHPEHPRWTLFLGAPVTGLDVSPDGRWFVAATTAGYVSIVQLDAGVRRPWQIGTGEHYEHRRWLVWPGSQPLAW